MVGVAPIAGDSPAVVRSPVDMNIERRTWSIKCGVERGGRGREPRLGIVGDAHSWIQCQEVGGGIRPIVSCLVAGIAAVVVGYAIKEIRCCVGGKVTFVKFTQHVGVRPGGGVGFAVRSSPVHVDVCKTAVAQVAVEGGVAYGRCGAGAIVDIGVTSPPTSA